MSGQLEILENIEAAQQPSSTPEDNATITSTEPHQVHQIGANEQTVDYENEAERDENEEKSDEVPLIPGDTRFV